MFYVHRICYAFGMKFRLFYFLLLACACLHGAGERLALMDIESGEGISVDEARQVSELLRSEFSKTSAFTIIDRNNMQDILQEQALSASGCTDNSCAIEIGRVLSARLMGVGRITRQAGRIKLVLRLVDVETTESVISESIDVVETGKESEISRLVAQISRRFEIQSMDLTLDYIRLLARKKNWIDAFVAVNAYFKQQDDPGDDARRLRQDIYQEWGAFMHDMAERKRRDRQYPEAERYITSALSVDSANLRYQELRDRIRTERLAAESEFVRRRFEAEKESRRKREAEITRLRARRQRAQRTAISRAERRGRVRTLSYRGWHLGATYSMPIVASFTVAGYYAAGFQAFFLGAFGNGTRRISLSPRFGVALDGSPAADRYYADICLSPLTMVTLKLGRLYINTGLDGALGLQTPSKLDVELLWGAGASLNAGLRLTSRVGFFTGARISAMTSLSGQSAWDQRIRFYLGLAL
jgi:TolB-like protein